MAKQRTPSEARPHTAVALQPFSYAILSTLAKERDMSVQQLIESLCDTYAQRWISQQAKG
ncbi:hypothetical protein [Vibrio agarivorans]|uniref:hypothetical protein n=1 Tax=Vibrio agarivorans TaxID=153622 RepID=UPI0025B42ADE|nr:hypothetical protein [Vibrio agarivorans]MDN3659954.1 hypothetical protein [Vibrio agarivorans]